MDKFFVTLFLAVVLCSHSCARIVDNPLGPQPSMRLTQTASEAGTQDLHFIVTTSVNGVVLPADNFGVACRAQDLLEPGKCRGGLAALRTVILSLASRAEGFEVVNLDLGDFRGATPFFSLYSGTISRELRTMMGYDFVAIGAGEFLAGAKELSAVIKDAPFKALSCNLDVLAMPQIEGVQTSGFYRFEKQGITLGIVGVYPKTETRGTNLGNPVILRNFDSSLAMAVVTTRGISDMVAVVGQWYLSLEDLEQVAEDIPGIDIIIANFDDQPPKVYKTRSGRSVAIASCPRGDCKGGAAAVLISVAVKDKEVVGVKVERADVDENVKDDPILGARIAELRRPLDASVTSVIGNAGTRLEGHEEFCRFEECTYGNFITQSLRHDVPADHIVLFNSGGIRGSIDPGSISRHTVDVSLPFPDHRVFLNVLGSDLVRNMRHSVRNVFEGNITGRFFQVAGLRAEYNPILGELVSLDVSTNELDIDGRPIYKPVILSNYYKVVTTTYIASGGDAYDFSRAETVREDATLIRDIIINVIQANGTVTQGIEGRLVKTEDGIKNFTCGDGLVRITRFDCKLCVAGQYRKNEIECAFCEDGTYSVTDGVSTCERCVANSRTFKVGATKLTDCQCQGGWYGEDGGECTLCPIGGYCPGGTNHVSTQAGHFRSPTSSKPAFRRCLPSSACLAGLDSACAEAYAGENCGECADNHFRILGLCQGCIGLHPAATLSITVVTVISILTVTVLVVGPIRERKARVLKALFGIVTNVLQIVSLLPAFYPGIWPDYLVGLRFVAMGSTMSLDLLGPECHGLTFLARYLLQAFFPFLLIGCLAFVFVCHAKLHVFLKKQETLARATKTLIPMYCRTVVACTVFLYLPMASHLLAWFDCTWEDDGSYYLFIHPATACYKGMWLQLLPVVLFLVLLYVIMVPYLLYRLYHAVRHHLNDEDFDHSQTEKDQYVQVVMYTSYLVISDVYRPDVANWRLVELGWKLAFVAARCLVVSGSFFRGVFGTILLSILVVMKVRYRPFKYDWVNIFDTGIHFAAYITSFAGLVLFIDLIPLTGLATSITEVSFIAGLLGIIFTPILALIYTFLLFWRRRIMAERARSMDIDIDVDSDEEVQVGGEDDDDSSDGMQSPRAAPNQKIRASNARLKNVARALMGGFSMRGVANRYPANDPPGQANPKRLWAKAAAAVASGEITMEQMAAINEQNTLAREASGKTTSLPLPNKAPNARFRTAISKVARGTGSQQSVRSEPAHALRSHHSASELPVDPHSNGLGVAPQRRMQSFTDLQRASAEMPVAEQPMHVDERMYHSHAPRVRAYPGEGFTPPQMYYSQQRGPPQRSVSPPPVPLTHIPPQHDVMPPENASPPSVIASRSGRVPADVVDPDHVHLAHPVPVSAPVELDPQPVAAAPPAAPPLRPKDRSSSHNLLEEGTRTPSVMRREVPTAPRSDPRPARSEPRNDSPLAGGRLPDISSYLTPPAESAAQRMKNLKSKSPRTPTRASPPPQRQSGDDDDGYDPPPLEMI